ISNASSGGLANPNQIRYLVSQGCIKPLCDLLNVADSKIVEVTLDSLVNILKIGDLDREQRQSATNEYAVFIEEAGGMEKIFNCQSNANENIYNKAYQIIEKYFGADEGDAFNEDGLQPEAYGDSYAFGVNNNQNFQF
ncbi:hypothetical protein OXX59_010087, partial [Metschnikowia pulcherrima]